MLKPATFEDIGFFAGFIVTLCATPLYAIIGGVVLMVVFQYLRWRRDKLIKLMVQYLMEQQENEGKK
jgi:hypothetical protein